MTTPVSRIAGYPITLVTAVTIIVAPGCTQPQAPPDNSPEASAAHIMAPADDSAEAGFARDMATHHDQAVEMAFMVRDVTADPRLRSLADDIIVTQSAQRGMFMAWLQLWDLPQASAGPRMVWMAERHAGEHTDMAQVHDAGDPSGLTPMAGMASGDQLDALQDATGREAEVLFLQLMIRHHEGGVLMARAALDRASHDAVVTLARGIENGQLGEIQSMTQMLTERGAQPLPSLLP